MAISVVIAPRLNSPTIQQSFTNPMKKLLACSILLLSLISNQANAAFILVETGGTFRTDATNIAAASSNATAIGSDELDYGIHLISHINDGLYGNDNSWIGNSTISWVGVIFTSPSDVGSFAFGRDNTGQLTDRSTNDPYLIEYTSSLVTSSSAAGATWTQIGSLDYSMAPPDSPYLRHLYNLDTPLSGVTAFRIQTLGGMGSGNAIDELEVYSAPAIIPEPSTYALLALGLLSCAGLAAKNRYMRRLRS
jgi:hypothetical protein